MVQLLSKLSDSLMKLEKFRVEELRSEDMLWFRSHFCCALAGLFIALGFMTFVEEKEDE